MATTEFILSVGDDNVVLTRIVAGKDSDPDLETGDVVVVKESLF